VLLFEFFFFFLSTLSVVSNADKILRENRQTEFSPMLSQFVSGEGQKEEKTEMEPCILTSVPFIWDN
jgi:hypothetical protein